MTEAAAEATEPEVAPPDQYWLRVCGYPEPIGDELIAYGDFYDPKVGPLSGDAQENLHQGDVVLFYADGPATVFGVGRVEGPAQAASNGAEGQRWHVPLKSEAVIPNMNKAPHAGGLRPPSGWHFLQAVRAYTFIRLPAEDGEYLVAQVKSRASTRGE